MRPGLRMGDSPCSHELLDLGMVGRQLLQPALGQRVDPGVPEVEDSPVWEPAGLDDAGAGERATHALAFRMRNGVADHSVVGAARGTPDVLDTGLAKVDALEYLDGEPTSDVSCRVAPHPVRHDEQHLACEQRVLIDRPVPADIGRRANLDHCHACTIVRGGPTCRSLGPRRPVRLRSVPRKGDTLR